MAELPGEDRAWIHQELRTGNVHEMEVERSAGALGVRPGASAMVPALAMGRPCWNHLSAVASSLKISKFQVRTGARLLLGAWDTGYPDITGALGLWPTGKACIEGSPA